MGRGGWRINTEEITVQRYRRIGGRFREKHSIARTISYVPADVKFKEEIFVEKSFGEYGGTLPVEGFTRVVQRNRV